MRTLYSLATLGVLLTGLVGCNVSWPSCFSRQGGCLSGGCLGRNQIPMQSYDCCDPCESYYVPGEMDVEWGPATTVQDLPMPGPEPQASGS